MEHEVDFVLASLRGRVELGPGLVSDPSEPRAYLVEQILELLWHRIIAEPCLEDVELPLNRLLMYGCSLPDQGRDADEFDVDQRRVIGQLASRCRSSSNHTVFPVSCIDTPHLSDIASMM